MTDRSWKDVGLKMARKHLGWYSSGLPKSSDFRASINQINNIKDAKNKIQEFYGPLV